MIRHLDCVTLGLCLVLLGCDNGPRPGTVPEARSSADLLQGGCDALATPEPDPSGRKIYVATWGSDSNSCDKATNAHPFGSIRAAAACARAGDTIYVMGGVYSGTHYLSNLTGTAGHWILITNNPGEKPILDGGGRVKDFEAIVTLANAAYVAFSGFEVRNTGVVGSPYGGGLGLNVANANHVVVSNNEIHHCARQALVWNASPSNVLAEGNNMHDNVLLNVNHQSLKILGYWDGTTSTARQDSSVNRCVSWKRNRVRASWGECMVAMRTDGGEMVGNVVSECYSVHLYVDSTSNYRVDGNYVYDVNDTYRRLDAGRATGIAIAKEYSNPNSNQALNVAITNNIIDSVGEGIRWGNFVSSDGYYGNVTVAHNTILNTRENSIHFDVPKQRSPAGVNYLYNNIVFKNAGQGTALLLGNPEAWTVRGNLWPNGVPGGLDSSNGALDPRLSTPTLGQAQTYKLAAGSPAIGKGIGGVAALPVVDFWGTVRSATAPSVGAHEAALNLSSSPPALGDGQQANWSLQRGTAGEEAINAVATDASGNVYVTGYTTGALEYTNQGGVDAFVVKYDAQHNKLWGRQLGGGGHDVGNGIAVDSAGNVYVVGSMTAPLLATYAGGEHDGFLAKYASDGTRRWVIGIGTPGDDLVYSVAVDSVGSIYLAGATTGNLEYTVQGGADAFVQKYDGSGSKLWGRQLGSAGDDIGYAIAVDKLNGKVWVGGTHTTPLYVTYYGGARDGFLAQYDAASGNRSWVVPIGTPGDDTVYGVTTNANGDAFVAGATTGAMEYTNQGGYDAFVRQYDSFGNRVDGRQLGTPGDESAQVIAVDGNGNLFLAGATSGAMFATQYGGKDVFVAKYNGALARMWVKQAGSAGNDSGNGIAVSQYVYVGGSSSGALSSPSSGGLDLVLWQYAPNN